MSTQSEKETKSSIKKRESIGHDTWWFIKHCKATQSASLKTLQKFILSLNKKELRHLIELYLKSMINTQYTTNHLPNKMAHNKSNSHHISQTKISFSKRKEKLLSNPYAKLKGYSLCKNLDKVQFQIQSCHF